MALQSSDWLFSNRTDSFRFVEVEFDEGGKLHNKSEITAIEETGGQIKYQDMTSLKVSASLPFAGDFDLGKNYIRIYSASMLGDKEITLLHGTFLPSRPSLDYSGAAVAGSIECYSLLKVLEDTALEEPLALSEFTDPVGQATLLIAETKLSFIADASTMLLSAPRTYDAGTSYLEVCNDLMEVAGFIPLAIDASGTVRLIRYADPANLTPVWTLRDDTEKVVFGPEVSYDFDTFDVPNKVIAVRSNSKEEESLIATAINEDPLSRFSTVSKGRIITYVETVNEAENLEALQDVAERVLSEKSSAVESVEISHPYLPYNTGDALRLVYTKHGLDFTGVVVSKEIELRRGMPTKTKLRRYVRR
jgi:hypothetical protein